MIDYKEFGFIKEKIFSSPVFLSILPGRFCIKNGLPLIATIPVSVRINSTGNKTIKATNDIRKSITRFNIFSYIKHFLTQHNNCILLFKTGFYNFNDNILFFLCHLYITRKA